MPEASSSQHTNPTEMFIFEVLKEWLCLVDIYRKLLPAYLFPATRALHPSMAVHW